MRFLCLHGIGTNNSIFKMQMGILPDQTQDGYVARVRWLTTHAAPIRQELGDQHTYEFVQGTLEWPMSPELKDISDAEATHYSYFEPTGDSVLRAIDDLGSYVQTEGPFDGIIGFSQGASLAVMYLITHAHMNCDARPPFTCAILFSRVVTYDPVAWRCNKEVRKLERIPFGGRKIDIPVAALWAENDLDHVKQAGTWTTELFEDQHCEILVHNSGHGVPGYSSKNCLSNAVKAIKRTIV